MMNRLITRNDIAQYRQISKTPHDDKLNEQILDAQMLDLQPLLGELLYNKIIASPEAYNDLLNGGTYQHNGESYQNYGLKMVLSYFTYSRYVMFGSVIDTPFSLVEKITDNSRPVEISNKKTMWNINRDAAMSIWENVRNYLIRTKQPDFHENRCAAPARSGFQFKVIG